MNRSYIIYTCRGVYGDETAKINVLKNGQLESSKDEFASINWKYAIRGNTVDGRDLRIIVKLSGKMMIITVIDKDN